MKIKQNQSLNETNNINQMSTQTPVKTGDTTFVDGLKDLDMVNSMKDTLDTKKSVEVSDAVQVENKEESSSKKIDDFCKSNIMYVAKNQENEKTEKNTKNDKVENKAETLVQPEDKSVKNNNKNNQEVPKMVMEEVLPEDEILRTEPKATLEEFIAILPENNKNKDNEIGKNTGFAELEETLQTFNELPKTSKKDKSENILEDKIDLPEKVENKEETLIQPKNNTEIEDKKSQKSEVTDLLEKDIRDILDNKKPVKQLPQMETSNKDFSMKNDKFEDNKNISDKNTKIGKADIIDNKKTHIEDNEMSNEILPAKNIDKKSENANDLNIIKDLSKEELKNLLHPKKMEKVSDTKVTNNINNTVKNELNFETKIKDFNDLNFTEKKDFINDFMKAGNKDFQPIQDKKSINKIINNILNAQNKAEAKNETLSMKDFTNIVNNVIKKDKVDVLPKTDNLVSNDTETKDITDSFEKSDDVKLNVDDFEPEVVKEQLKPQIEILDAIKEQAKFNNPVEKVEQVNDNKVNDIKTQPLQSKNIDNKEFQPKQNQEVELVKPEIKNLQPNNHVEMTKHFENKNVEDVKNEVGKPVEMVKPIENKHVENLQKSVNKSVELEKPVENKTTVLQPHQVKSEVKPVEVENKTNLLQQSQMKPEVKPVEVENKKSILQLEKQVKNIQPKVEEKPIENKMLNQILSEEVDLTKKIPAMEEVIPEQLRKPVQKTEQKPEVKVETPVQMERTAIEPEKKQPLEELNKFLTEIMAEDTVESLKSKDVSMIDDNTLLTEEIKNYYNLNKAQNLAATEDVKNVINERIAEINDLSAIVETAQEAKAIQKDLKALDVQKVQPKKVETKQLKMTEQDANFFIELVKNNQESGQTVADTATQILQDLQKADETQQTTRVSKALADMIGEAAKTNKPFRIDFDKNISVIIKIDREGKISAEFLPGDKAVEQFLRTQLPMLRQKFNDENIDYKDLNYRQSNGGRQNRERRRRGE